MADQYEKIRKALEMGPTPGPWIVTHELRECVETVCDLVNGTWIVTAPGVKLAHWEYDAAHIAACDPDTIRTLLTERDALVAEAERLAMALRLAEEHINALTPEWYNAGQRVLAEIRAALGEENSDA